MKIYKECYQVFCCNVLCGSPSNYQKLDTCVLVDILFLLCLVDEPGKISYKQHMLNFLLVSQTASWSSSRRLPGAGAPQPRHCPRHHHPLLPHHRPGHRRM